MRTHTTTQTSASVAPPIGAKRPRPEPAATPSADAPLLTMAPGPALLDGPSRDEMIRARAYERYAHNGCVDGLAEEDWLAAEAEVGALLSEAGRLASATAA